MWSHFTRAPVDGLSDNYSASGFETFGIERVFPYRHLGNRVTGGYLKHLVLPRFKQAPTNGAQDEQNCDQAALCAFRRIPDALPLPLLSRPGPCYLGKAGGRDGGQDVGG